MSIPYPPPKIKNLILGALEPEIYGRVRHLLGRTHFYPGLQLYPNGLNTDFAIFPLSCVVSQGVHTQNGQSLETMLIDHRGVAGPMNLAQYGREPWSVIKKEGVGYTLDLETCSEVLNQSQTFRNLLLIQTKTRLLNTSKNANCFLRHSIGKRLPRWLLETSQTLNSTTIKATHEQIAQALGVRRETVTKAMHRLEFNAIITCKPPLITILDVRHLQDKACYCTHLEY